MKLFLTLVAVTALMGLAGAVNQNCQPTTSTPTLTVGTYPHVFYYVGDNCGGDCIYAWFVYMESNGLPGLQRGDFDHDDTCGGAISSDAVML